MKRKNNLYIHTYIYIYVYTEISIEIGRYSTYSRTVMYLKESDWNMYLSKNCKLESESVYCRLQVNFSGDIQSSFWPRSVLTASFLPAIVLMGWQELGLAVDRYLQMYINIKYTYIYIPHVCKYIYIYSKYTCFIHTYNQTTTLFIRWGNQTMHMHYCKNSNVDSESFRV